MVCSCGSVRQQLWRSWKDLDIIEIRETGSQACFNRESGVAVNVELTCKRCVFTNISEIFLFPKSPKIYYSMFHANQT